MRELFLDAYRGGVTFDRTWTFHRADNTSDVMVEVTYLGATPDTPRSGETHASVMDVASFETELSTLLSQGSRPLPDRAWTFQCSDCVDMMVEITRLAKQPSVGTTL
ncbi:hypothetical protein [Haladaptatus sp. NG-WS-4]